MNRGGNLANNSNFETKFYYKCQYFALKIHPQDAKNYKINRKFKSFYKFPGIYDKYTDNNEKYNKNRLFLI